MFYSFYPFLAFSQFCPLSLFVPFSRSLPINSYSFFSFLHSVIWFCYSPLTSTCFINPLFTFQPSPAYTLDSSLFVSYYRHSPPPATQSLLSLFTYLSSIFFHSLTLQPYYRPLLILYLFFFLNSFPSHIPFLYLVTFLLLLFSLIYSLFVTLSYLLLIFLYLHIKPLTSFFASITHLLTLISAILSFFYSLMLFLFNCPVSSSSKLLFINIIFFFSSQQQF
ncbi:unnamed protein product [Acanthosepion pharaonis]|uniref:Uncharacterized protein n=1 Tax=Acanthosepion pharaonis TaxID=158019 RepID=A0A812DA08_ACAPH|nr:unnamed protein product [Sepia pharaonis]